MQLFALDENKNRIFVENATKGLDYFCLECGSTLRLRGGMHMQLHFYHLEPPDSCRQHGKGSAHIRIQNYIQQKLGSECEQEVRFSEISRIADLAFFKEKIIFEVQCSPIAANEVQSRIKDYKSVGWEVIWLLNDYLFNKKRATYAEAFLEKHPHYFVHVKEDDLYFYDQASAIHRGKRTHFFVDNCSLKWEIDLSLLKKNTFKEADVKLPYSVQKRIATWPLFCTSDVIDRAKNGDLQEYFQSIKEEEERLFIKPKKGIFPQKEEKETFLQYAKRSFASFLYNVKERMRAILIDANLSS